MILRAEIQGAWSLCAYLIKKGKESGHLPLPRRFSPWPDDQPTVIEFTQRSYVPESSWHLHNRVMNFPKKPPDSATQERLVPARWVTSAALHSMLIWNKIDKVGNIGKWSFPNSLAHSCLVKSYRFFSNLKVPILNYNFCNGPSTAHCIFDSQ